MHYLVITRPLNLLIALLSFSVALYLSSEVFLFKDILGAVVVIFITAAGNVINDFFDVETDRIEHPKRPIVCGKISKKKALLYSTLLFVIGIGISYFINKIVFFITLTVSLLLFFYSAFLKRMPLIGNITVSFVSASIFLFVAGYHGKLKLFIFPASMVFFFHLTREIIKDVEDIEGDKRLGMKTLPIVIGKRKSVIFSFFTGLFFILSTFLPWIKGYFSTHYLVSVIFFVDVPFFVLILLMLFKLNFASKVERCMKFLMIPGLGVLLLV